jgi:hypothetical protein
MPGNPRECRVRAFQCLKLAQMARSPKSEELFNRLARTWAKLANAIESDDTLLEEWGRESRVV